METLRGMYYDLAGFPLPRQLKALLEIADPKHILYGSDYPFTPEPVVTALAAQLDGCPELSTAIRTDFMRNNALSLFPKFANTGSLDISPSFFLNRKEYDRQRQFMLALSVVM